MSIRSILPAGLCSLMACAAADGGVTSEAVEAAPEALTDGILILSWPDTYSNSTAAFDDMVVTLETCPVCAHLRYQAPSDGYSLVGARLYIECAVAGDPSIPAVKTHIDYGPHEIVRGLDEEPAIFCDDSFDEVSIALALVEVNGP